MKRSLISHAALPDVGMLRMIFCLQHAHAELAITYEEPPPPGNIIRGGRGPTSIAPSGRKCEQDTHRVHSPSIQSPSLLPRSWFSARARPIRCSRQIRGYLGQRAWHIGCRWARCRHVPPTRRVNAKHALNLLRGALDRWATALRRVEAGAFDALSISRPSSGRSCSSCGSARQRGGIGRASWPPHRPDCPR